MTITPAIRRTTLAFPLLLLVALGGCGEPGAPSGAPSSSATAPRTAAATQAVDGGLRPAGETETASIVRVVDGDTVIIDRGRGNERLRYIGVDTPESVKPDTPVQFMGKEATDANAALVKGRTVVLERDVSETDQYGRLLRYVWVHDGDAWLFVNLELVRRGFAHVVTYPPDVRWTDTFRSAQRAARDAGLGLWGPATPLP